MVVLQAIVMKIMIFRILRGKKKGNYHIMKRKKVVLAFSGGLDTSFCAMYLSKEKDFDVYTAIANTGGFCESELKSIEEKAYKLGAVKHVTLDVTCEYYEKKIGRASCRERV